MALQFKLQLMTRWTNTIKQTDLMSAHGFFMPAVVYEQLAMIKSGYYTSIL